MVTFGCMLLLECMKLEHVWAVDVVGCGLADSVSDISNLHVVNLQGYF